jgi:hypothetical protein
MEEYVWNLETLVQAQMDLRGLTLSAKPYDLYCRLMKCVQHFKERQVVLYIEGLPALSALRVEMEVTGDWKRVADLGPHGHLWVDKWALRADLLALLMVWEQRMEDGHVMSPVVVLAVPQDQRLPRLILQVL